MKLPSKNHLLISLLLAATPILSQDFKLEKIYEVKQARQGVAVDGNFFYVINNREIVKYTREDGTLVKQWQDTTAGIQHLNSGIIIKGKLFCAHSNYPDSPMASSIEIFDPFALKHTESISFGIYIGSATWLDFYKGHWYVAFAHYSGRGSAEGRSNKWTQLVEFTEDWQRLQSWIFPEELLLKFGTRSNSGGFITDEGSIYITGHDNKELYELEFPKIGYTLLWRKTYPIPYEGQGIALDASTNKTLTLYGIIRKENKVIKTTIKK